jgi:hypothetical protein
MMTTLYTITVANEDGEVLERIEFVPSLLDDLLRELFGFEYDPEFDEED